MIYVITNELLILPEDKFTVQHDLNYLLQYWKDKDVIAVDTETTTFRPWDGKLLTIQLGDSDNQFIINWQAVGEEFTEPIKKLLESKLLVFQNVKFDWQWLYHNGIDVRNIYDTFLGECILTTGYSVRQLGLADISRKYTGIEVSKDDRGLINRVGLTERVLKYCAEDVAHLGEIRDKQLKKIEGFNLEKVLELECLVVRALALMEYNGVLIDEKKWLEVAEEAERTIKSTVEKLDVIVEEKAGFNDRLRKHLNLQTNLFGFEERKTKINWASNKQKGIILGELGYSVPDVADKTLQKMKHKHKIFKELITFSKHQKLATSFGKNFLKFVNKNTGRVHSEIWQILATGRLAMSKPNLQQIPAHGVLGEKIRSCFIARPGHVLVTTDVVGFEARIVTEFSQDPLWLSIYNEGKDLHSEVCTKLFGIPLSDVKKPFPPKPDLTYRFVAKTIKC